MRVRRRKEVYEATQWFPEASIDGVYREPVASMPLDMAECLTEGINAGLPVCAAVQCHGGWTLLVPGDWVIDGPYGLSVCRAQMFDALFEPTER